MQQGHAAVKGKAKIDFSVHLSKPDNMFVLYSVDFRILQMSDFVRNS